MSDVDETMHDDTTQADLIAAALWAAEQGRAPVAPPSASHPHLDLAGAYRVQRINISRRLDEGQTRVGHKVGLTSLAMQAQLGVDRPDFGVITDTMVVANGGMLALDELIAPRVEAEFAFVIGRPLVARPSVEELREAVTGVAVALEIIDSRVADWRITLVDTVADNASSARIVVGPIRAATDAVLAETVDAVISLQHDEEQVAEGPGSAVLGDPVRALHWLSDALADFGDAFDPGDIVLAGAVHASLALTGGIWTAGAPGFENATFHGITSGSIQ